MAASRQSTVRQGHATFVNACENPTPKKLSRQNSPTVVETGALLHPGDDAVELKREATRRTLFQKTSNNVLDIPNGYRKVEVLILRWDESIDEFNKGHNQEVTSAAHESRTSILMLPRSKDSRVSSPQVLATESRSRASRITATLR
jgi:hypothetical protein